MKAPSKNITQSLKGQSPGGRGGEKVQVSGLSKGVSMTVPGEGTVQTAPGMVPEASAVHYAAPCDKVK